MSLQELATDFSTPPSLENPDRKRPVSERRVQANRRNALRSTGPKTARGKRAVAGNAIKHGFLAREVVITAWHGEESLKEFHDLVEKICEHYGAIGVVEELLVQTIATCWWRKARVIRAENGEIRRRLESVAVDRALRNSDERLSAFAGRGELVGDAEAQSFSLPPADAADKLLRYEAHLDRQLYRAMDQLERLQRQRKGESVPPPININLSNRRI